MNTDVLDEARLEETGDGKPLLRNSNGRTEIPNHLFYRVRIPLVESTYQ